MSTSPKASLRARPSSAPVQHETRQSLALEILDKLKSRDLTLESALQTRSFDLTPLDRLMLLGVSSSILPELATQTVVERKQRLDFGPDSALLPLQGATCSREYYATYPLEHFDFEADWYRKHFMEKEHRLYLATTSALGPVLVSIKDERNTIDELLFRIILRTKFVRVFLQIHE